MQICRATRQLRVVEDYLPKRGRVAYFRRWNHTLDQEDASATRLKRALSSQENKYTSSHEDFGNVEQTTSERTPNPEKHSWTRGARLSQESIPSDLPIPPMFLEDPKPRLKHIYSTPDPEKHYDPRHYKIKKLKALSAPFSTAFHHNPYAHALATPARHCPLTGIRVPRSCLIDFHMVETGEEDGKPIRSLLPLSLAAATVPKKKNVAQRTEEEILLTNKWGGESASRTPTGVASYVSGQKRVIEFVSAHKEWQSRVCSRRLLISYKKVALSLNWRADMPEFILHSLQKLVTKKLRYFMANKGVSDKLGLICEQPGGGPKLTRLNHIDGVSCVLELKSPKIYEDTKEEYDSSLEGERLTLADHQLPRNSIEPESISNTGETEPATKTKSKAQFDPETGLPITHREQDGPWVDHASEARTVGTKPLSPPRQPMRTYYPTVRYRNRRAPLYNLELLLGQENLTKVLQGTVFEESSYVMILTDHSTVDVQLWLMKLYTYIAGSKSEMLGATTLS